MKKFLLLFLILLVSCSASNQNDETLRKFDLEDIKIEIEVLSYDEMSSNNKLNGMVLVVRDDCEYCHEMLEVFKEEIKLIEDSADFSNIYLIDSGDMTVEEKTSFIKKYSITSVPTIAIFKDGEPKLLEIGIPPNERMLELIKQLTN